MIASETRSKLTEMAVEKAVEKAAVLCVALGLCLGTPHAHPTQCSRTQDSCKYRLVGSSIIVMQCIPLC